MQTFLPYPDFQLSARVLDRQRLGKQRVETMQIMIALTEGRGWVNHPAVKMWAGHERYLLEYQDFICDEWLNRGYEDSCWPKTVDIFRSARFSHALTRPFWLGDIEFHRSHQSNLIRKDRDHYGPQFPGVPDNLEYVWPV